MGKSIFVSALCLWLSISGCATQRLELRVTGTDSIVVGLKLTNEMLNLGYYVREQSDNLIVFEKQITDAIGYTWSAGRYDMNPSSRVSYRLCEKDGIVCVVADLKVITNPGKRFERVAEAAQHPDSALIQEVLRKMENDLENQKKNDTQSKEGNMSSKKLK